MSSSYYEPHFLLLRAKNYLYHYLPPTGCSLLFPSMLCDKDIQMRCLPMQSIFHPNSAWDSFVIFPTAVTQQFPYVIEAIQTFHELFVNYDSKNLKLQVWSLDLYSANKFRISPFLLHVHRKHQEKALLFYETASDPLFQTSSNHFSSHPVFATAFECNATE
jgi:hypothetical protein